METQFIFHGWLRFVLASLGRGSFLLGTVLLFFSSLTYAVEQGEYKHYMGFAISGGSFSDGLQKIDFASDDTDESSDNTDEPSISVVDSDLEEGGSLFVWDAFDLDNQWALSLMLLSVWEDESGTYSNGVAYDAETGLGGLLVAGKYFTQSGLYIGGGGTFLSLSREGIFSYRNRVGNVDITSDSFFAPTVVLGYRGLVSRLENFDFYIGADYVTTLPVDVDYQADFVGVGIVETTSGTYEELSISMLAVSFGWAW